MATQTYKKFVLYISSDNRDSTQFCYGSRECLKFVDPIKEDVTVQHVDRMMEAGVQLPEWLDGTPILVNTMEKTAHRGTDAYEYLKSIKSGNTQEPEEEEESGFLNGVMPDGEMYLHEAGDEIDLDHSANSAETQIINETKEGKVTENDLQRYMELRNKSGA
tara:strand:- start:1703 stop:2188 length:486 start_codon:yes stop_codon:yes gene_type:complete